MEKKGKGRQRQRGCVAEHNLAVSQSVLCIKFEQLNEAQETWSTYLVR